MKNIKGTRKGISLVEILIAIILFGVVTSLSFTYYKTYYDTSTAAKQARVSVITDQASQLSNAYLLYTTKYGIDPATPQDFVDKKFLTAVPIAQPLITSSGWAIDTNLSLENNSTGRGYGFVYNIDANVSQRDRLDYCNILNNNAETTWKLDTNESTILDENIMWNRGNDSNDSQMEYFFCSDVNQTTVDKDYAFKMVFVVRGYTLP